MIIKCSDRQIEFNDKTEPKVTVIYAKNKVEQLKYSSKLALTAAFEHFLKIIHTKNTSFTNTPLGLKVVKAVHDIEQKLP